MWRCRCSVRAVRWSRRSSCRPRPRQQPAADPGAADHRHPEPVPRIGRVRRRRATERCPDRPQAVGLAGRRRRLTATVCIDDARANIAEPGSPPRRIQTAATDRQHAGGGRPRDGVPVLFVHGNVSSSLFWQPLMLALPEQFRPIAMDLRGFGDTDPEPVDATRGVRDYCDDVAPLVFEALGWRRCTGRLEPGRRGGAAVSARCAGSSSPP